MAETMTTRSADRRAKKDVAAASGTLAKLRVKTFADGTDLASLREIQANPLVKGFTTNPTLMRKSGIVDYRTFARTMLDTVRDRPVSFEVLSDDFEVMYRQATELATWGPNVFVKIPITDTRGASSADLLRRLAREGVQLNVTAITTLEQVVRALDAVAASPAAVISVFAGRIADTGRDPMPVMRQAVEVISPHLNLELLWASPREVLNVYQADEVGCQIVTVTADILRKLELAGRDLHEVSLDTVRMFVRDAELAGLEL
ncbi:MAG: transaldolase [Chloroflexota bacterium]|nr:transaldolase [Chloroflexota bacterium]